MTAIVAALPRELQELVRGWKRLPISRPGVVVYATSQVRAASAGMGVERAALAVEAALAGGEAGVDRLISFGLAGACDPALQAGEVRWCGSVVDVRSGERFEALEDGPLLATSANIADVKEKLRLRESYGAALVDMEAAGVARLARAHGLGFSALKAVSDTADTALVGADQFVTRDGGFRELAYGVYLAMRPSRWRGAVTLGRASSSGLRAATAELARSLKDQETR